MVTHSLCHALACISEAYTQVDIRFMQPPHTGVSPSHRLLRARHSSHARAARLRISFPLGAALRPPTLGPRRRLVGGSGSALLRESTMVAKGQHDQMAVQTKDNTNDSSE